MAEKLGIENVKDLVVAGVKTYEALAAAKKDDGKINMADLPKIFPLLPAYMAALTSLDQVMPELKDFSADEASQLLTYVASELGAQVSPELSNKIEKVLLAIKADYEAVRAFM